MQDKFIKIEIEMQVIDKTLAGLAVAMGDKGFEALVSTFIISFETEKPDDWLTDKRKNDFEKKYNELNSTEFISYEVLSIKKMW